jgi:membrane glycosyltransferase
MQSRAQPNRLQRITDASDARTLRTRMSGNADSGQAAGIRRTASADAGDRVSMPPVHRTVMAPPRLDRAVDGEHRAGAREASTAATPDAPANTQVARSARRRRLGLLTLTLGQTWLATDYMATVLPYQGSQPLEIAMLVLFAMLFAWVSAGFWTAVAGFFLLLFGKDRHAISAKAASDAPIDPAARTAVIMPICNEDVARVFAGLRATYESLRRTDAFDRFDFFVLSDTNDADVRVAEQFAWEDLCNEVSGSGRIFYRWRRVRIRRKSGNVADFCRRWGADYRYMVVLDADSVMTGDCLKRLVQLMEAEPGAGIIQTIPRAAGRETLHARIQQFAAGAYGPMLAAGLHFWQLGESHYWGHNAIIRVEPFMRHCALPRLPGRGVLAGEILSHDFVEAAFMRRAGYGVWIAYDLEGSYEEMPPNLLDEIKRDRRWCQGNLMNARLIAARGIHPVHRVVFGTGVMAYSSSLLWSLALVLSTALLAVHVLSDPVYFAQPYQLFPTWPEWRPERAVALFTTTLSLLLLPKLLGIVLVLRGGARRFGGALRSVVSMLGEMVVSALLAPVRMLFHAQFVLAALAGHAVQWKSPPRDDTETSWSEAVRRHGWQVVIGACWIGVVAWLDPAHVGWLLPVAGAMVLSVPVSVLLSRASLGRACRRLGLFVVPEEAAGVRELQETAAHARADVEGAGLAQAIVDPALNERARSLALRQSASGVVAHRRMELVARALMRGLASLSARERLALVEQADALRELNALVTRSELAHGSWRASRAGKAPGAREPADGLPQTMAAAAAMAVPLESGQPQLAR